MSVCLCVIVVFAAFTAVTTAAFTSRILNTTELIARAGYQSERHEVVAQDGFRITVFRIPGSGTPVLLAHGLFVASDYWVIRGKDRDLVFLLSDLGYDVWMADNRGNWYSRNHNTFTPEDSVFWDFSVEEMGSYDLPAVIDHVLNVTGHSSLVYVGHSLGTTMMYVMSARRPEYVYKVRLMVGLAPAAFFGRYRAAFQRFLLESSSSYSGVFGRLGLHEVLPRTQTLATLSQLLCSEHSPTQNLCLQFLYFTAGLGSLSDFSHINRTLVSQFACHLPTGTSPKTLGHLGQLSMTGRFCSYDYGAKENTERYGTATPPDYDLSLTAMPVLNFHGESDLLTDERDATELSSKLPNLIADVTVEYPLFNHMDFIWAENAKELVYQQIIDTIAKYDT